MRNKVRLEELTDAQLVKILPLSYGAQSSLSFTHELTFDPRPARDESSPHASILSVNAVARKLLCPRIITVDRTELPPYGAPVSRLLSITADRRKLAGVV